MINNVLLVGRLTRDPELRKTQNGTSNVQFIMAVGRDLKQEGQPDADFINCVAWGKTADIIVNHLHKGSLFDVEGRIQTRNYQDKQGQTHYVTEVIVSRIHFLESKNTNNVSQNSYATQNPYARNNDDTLDIDSDDLPF